MPASLTLTLLADLYAVCRLPAGSPLPAWAADLQPFVSLTRTSDEVSVTCPQAAVPAGIQQDADWRVLKLEGPFDLALTGILAPIAAALADARVNVFVVSTYDTDYVLVKAARLEEAFRAIETLGHRIHGLR